MRDAPQDLEYNILKAHKGLDATWCCACPDAGKFSRGHDPTRPLTTFAIGGIDVNNTVIVPNRLIDKLDSAAALGSERRRRAVATAEELAPNVTPRVT